MNQSVMNEHECLNWLVSIETPEGQSAGLPVKIFQVLSCKSEKRASRASASMLIIIMIIIDNFCIALFSGVPKLIALYNILQHFLSFANIIHIIMTTNNV